MMTNPSTISAAGLTNLTKKFEGCRLRAYKPVPNDPWTIGYGHTDGVKAGDVWTQDQAEAALTADMKIREKLVQSVVKVALTQHQFDALVDFVYNVGAGNFRSSSLLTKLNAGNYTGAADAFLLWKFAHGIPLNGLIRRREAERAWFLTPD